MKGFADGFHALATTADRDGDGWITGAELAGLGIWHDADLNRRATKDELSPLAESGVIALRAVPRDTTRRFVTKGPGIDGFVAGIADAYVVRDDGIEPAALVDVYLR